MRYVVLALAVLALLLAGTRYGSRAPGRTDVPAIELLSDPAAIERPEASKKRPEALKPKEKKRKAKPSGGAAPAPAPAPAPAGDDDSEDGDDD